MNGRDELGQGERVKEMAHRVGVGRARLLSIIAAVAVFAAVVLLAGSAVAAENNAALLTAVQLDQLFNQLQSGPVYQSICTRCHANIANTKNFSSEIIFTHGNHIRFECSACHPKFPHQANQLTSKPTMKACWNCHGLYHSNMGSVASGKCEDCHKTAKINLRPGFHVYNWKFKPHVKPAEEALNTRCMMCHDRPFCDDCHDAEGLKWSPANNNWDYSSGDGCLACHGQTTLTKQGANGPESFMVSGVDGSAHNKLTCQQCHVDFNYEDTKPTSPNWKLNVGVACGECHDHDKAQQVYEKSIHYQKLQEALNTSATVTVPTTLATSDKAKDPATCASCHGGHFIQRLNTPLSKAMLHASARRVCASAGCHAKEYTTYNDYYHGAAYKNGAPDAPACWDCHGYHDILPSADKASKTSAENLPKTCGSCHKGSEASFAEQGGQLIHQKSDVQSSNPVRAWFSRVFGQL